MLKYIFESWKSLKGEKKEKNRKVWFKGEKEEQDKEVFGEMASLPAVATAWSRWVCAGEVNFWVSEN